MKENSLRASLKGRFARAALAVGTAFATLAANPALADEAERQGQLLTSDIREATPFVLEHAPYAASRGRLAVIMYGNDPKILSAVGSAAKHYATKSPGNVDVSFLWARDNDGNPDTARVGIFANGRHFSTHDIGNRNPADAIVQAIYDDLRYADHEILKNAELAEAPAPSNSTD